MPSTFTTRLRLTLPATGELVNTWGTTVNTGITELVDASIAGAATLSTWGGAGVAYTLSNNNGVADEARCMFIVAAGSPGENKNIICPAVSKLYVVKNEVAGGFSVTLKTASGSGVTVENGNTAILRCTGTDVVDAITQLPAFSLAGGTVNGVVYLNASRTLTTGSALTFDGSSLNVAGGSIAGTKFNISSEGSGSAYLTTGYVRFVNAGGETARIDASGNLGIGGIPTKKFEVVSSSAADAMAVSSLVPGSPANIDAQQFSAWYATSPTAGLTFSGSDPRLLSMTVTPSNEIALRAAKPILLGTSYLALGVVSEAMRINASNNIGMGSTPLGTARLTVYSPQNTVQIRADDGNVTAYVAYSSGTGVNAINYFGTASNHPQAFITNNTEHLRILTTGGITSSDLADAVGYKGVPINSQSVNYTLVMADQGKTILHPIADNNARTFTIPANGAVAFPVGTVVTFINLINTVTISINSDTMYLAGTGSTGSRTLAAYGVASAVKVDSTTWVISGNGLT